LKDKVKRGIGLRYAISGLKIAFKEEKNFRIHLVIAIIVIMLSIVLQISRIEWLFVLLAIHLVFITELLNSVAERLIDYIKPDIHPLAGAIKDIAAAIVLVASLMSIFVGCIVFIPKLLALFFSFNV